MIRQLILVLCLALWMQPVHAQTPGNISERMWFDVKLLPDYIADRDAYVGGEMVLEIRFISVDPFKRLRMELPVIAGAFTETLLRPGTRQIELEGDEGYSVLTGRAYSHEARLTVVPNEAGNLVIPPIRITGIAELGQGRSEPFEHIYPETVITVHAPDPNFVGEDWLVSREVTIEDSWDPEITGIQAGDTVHRRVKLSVVGLTANDLPELRLESNDGYRVLNTTSTIETETTFDGYVAHLDQSWELYIESEETTHIDEIRFDYWNPKTARAEWVALERQRIEPLPRHASELRDRLREEVIAEREAKQIGLVVLLLLPVVVASLFLAIAVWRLLPTPSDVRLWRAARRPGPALQFYGDFIAWSRQNFRAQRPGAIGQMSDLGARAATAVTHMHRALFGRDGGDVQPSQVARKLIAARRWRAMTRVLGAIRPALSRFMFLR